MFERLPSFLFAGPCARRAVCGAPEHEDHNQAGGGLPHSSTEGGFHGRPGGIWKLLRRVLLNEGPVHQTTASLKGITATPDGIPAAVHPSPYFHCSSPDRPRPGADQVRSVCLCGP